MVTVGNEATSVTLLVRLHSRYQQVLADVVPGGTEVEHLVFDVCEVVVIRVLLRRCRREEIPDYRKYDWTRENLYVSTELSIWFNGAEEKDSYSRC